MTGALPHDARELAAELARRAPALAAELLPHDRPRLILIDGGKLSTGDAD